MVCTELGMVRLCSVVISLNAPLEMAVTVLGMTVLRHPCVRVLVAVSMMALQLLRLS